MEIKIEFTGALDDKIFVKHSGVNNYDIKTENYYATFDQNTNTIKIIKPIFNEEFMVTVLVGPKNHFNDYTLCTFAENQQKADYINSFSSVGTNEYSIIPESEVFLLIYNLLSFNTTKL